MDNIRLKVNDIVKTFNTLNDLVESNGSPFRGQARRLLFEMQPDYKFILSSSEQDLKDVQDKDIEFGEKIVAPQYYPDEYKPILEKVCKELPEKKSKVEQLMEK